MSVVRIKSLTVGLGLLLAACSGGGEVTANDTVSATPQPGDPAALPAMQTPERGAGIITIQSTHATPDTVARLKALIAHNGLMLLGVVDAQADAKALGQSLRPTTTVLFGDPRSVTPLMEADQSIALDLPERVLVYTDRAGQTWLAYDDPAWTAARHGVTGRDAVLQRVARTLDQLVHAAAN